MKEYTIDLWANYKCVTHIVADSEEKAVEKAYELMEDSYRKRLPDKLFTGMHTFEFDYPYAECVGEKETDITEQ